MAQPFSSPRSRCTGVVLAGGAASRFGGRAKGLETLGGVRVIDRVVSALRSCTDDVLLVANDPGAGTWCDGLRVVRDEHAGSGPLEGVRVAIEHAASAVLVVAWDMPFVPASLLASLRALGEARVAAAAPEGPNGAEPLCAYYPASCAPVLRGLLERGERRARALLDHVPVTVMPRDDVQRHGDPDHVLASVNTPRDLERARAWLAARGRA